MFPFRTSYAPGNRNNHHLTAARNTNPLGERTLGERAESSRSRTLAIRSQSNYRYYMTTIELKVARIGNSRGVRLPATTLARYGIGERVLMEERTDGILLRPARQTETKLSWEETAL